MRTLAIREAAVLYLKGASWGQRRRSGPVLWDGVRPGVAHLTLPGAFSAQRIGFVGGFHGIHALVGAADQLGRRGDGRDAGDAVRQAHAPRAEDVFGAGLQAAGDGGGAAGGRAGQKGDELVAAVAEEEVHLLAHALQQRDGKILQDPVALEVAAKVVDALEAVEIHEDERERLALPLGAGKLLLQAVAEMALVIKARQIVGDGELAQAVFELHAWGYVLDRKSTRLNSSHV